MAGKLRIAIESWIYDKVQPSGGPGWWGRVSQRDKEINEIINNNMRSTGTTNFTKLPMLFVAGILYTLTGSVAAKNMVLNQFGSTLNVDASEDIASAINKMFSNPVSNEVVESIGAVITEPVLTIFEKYAGRDDLDPKEFARAFHGFMISLNLTGGIASTVIEALSAGTIKGAGKMLDQMYWSLGLGFLGWQTLAPLLTSGLQPGLDRYYKRLYRPQRFSAGDLRDLYAIGKITAEELTDAAKTEGWRDQDIEQWIMLAYRNISESDAWQAYHEHFITEDEMIKRLRIQGYNPDDIPLLFKVNPAKDTSEVKDFSASTAKSAFENGLMSAEELKAVLLGLNYSEKEADTIVQLEQLKRQGSAKSLTLSQIKSAWTENVITDPEADHWLEVNGFAPAERTIILDTWKAESVPVFRKLNIGTIEGAYVAGILNRSQAQSRLEAIGLATDDAKLELDLTEKRNPDAFGLTSTLTRKYLSVAQLADLVSVNLITSDQMTANLIAQGYLSSDAILLTRAATEEFAPAERPLSQLSVERAYIARIIDRNKAASLLAALGLTADNSATVLDTVEAENPEVFGGSAENATKTLTPTILNNLYVAGIIDETQLRAYLAQLGYSQENIDQLVEQSILNAQPYVRPLTAIQIQQAYLYAIIDRSTAIEKLGNVGYTPEDAEELIATTEAQYPYVFDPSLVGSTRIPSITTLAAAVRNEIITVDNYYARATELGYSQTDAATYLSLATSQTRKSIQTLTVAQLLSAYDAGLLSFAMTQSRITQNGYSDDDATLLIRTRKDLIQNTDIWYSLTTGDLSVMDALDQLVSAGYADEDIYNAFAAADTSLLASAELTLVDLQQILSIIPGGS